MKLFLKHRLYEKNLFSLFNIPENNMNNLLRWGCEYRTLKFIEFFRDKYGSIKPIEIETDWNVSYTPEIMNKEHIDTIIEYYAAGNDRKDIIDSIRSNTEYRSIRHFVDAIMIHYNPSLFYQHFTWEIYDWIDKPSRIDLYRKYATFNKRYELIAYFDCWFPRTWMTYVDAILLNMPFIYEYTVNEDYDAEHNMTILTEAFEYLEKNSKYYLENYPECESGMKYLEDIITGRKVGKSYNSLTEIGRIIYG